MNKEQGMMNGNEMIITSNFLVHYSLFDILSLVLIMVMLFLGAWKYRKLKHPATYLALGVNLFNFLLEPLGRSVDVQLFLNALIKG
ncbi:MAG TPA: hypothetical protein VK489_02895 [Ferruginibacter sp.]|nr:hypothetical protein [Ferruginibacter sp.]